MLSERLKVSATTSNALNGRRLQFMPFDGVVRLYAMAEEATCRVGLEVGGVSATSDAQPRIGTIDQGPIIPDDLIAETVGRKGSQVIVQVTALAATKAVNLMVKIDPIGR